MQDQFNPNPQDTFSVSDAQLDQAFESLSPYELPADFVQRVMTNVAAAAIPVVRFRLHLSDILVPLLFALFLGLIFFPEAAAETVFRTATFDIPSVEPLWGLLAFEWPAFESIGWAPIILLGLLAEGVLIGFVGWWLWNDNDEGNLFDYGQI